MAKKPEKSAVGGARPGAGRKRLYGKSETQTIAAAVPVPLVGQLDKWAEGQSLTRSQAVAEAIRRLVS